MLISSLLTPDDEQETHVTTEDLIDENGEVNYETIEYETTIDSINENFVVLSPEVTDAYWKYYRWGDGFIGPTSQKLCGFLAMSKGWTQKQFNDYMNNPDFYQIESPSSNRSHKFEMPK